MTTDDDPCQIQIQIRYAPLQDERNVATSAALEFSKRAARIFENNNTTGSSAKVDVSFIGDGDGDGDLPSTTDSINDPSVLRLTVFLISCAADGSIHREVRKLTKAVKEEKSSSSLSSDKECYAVALLGHAVCDNSAKQMADAVFGAGRRLVKALQKKRTGGECCPVFVVETQVELVAPEEGFDGWVEGLIAKTKTSSRTTS